MPLPPLPPVPNTPAELFVAASAGYLLYVAAFLSFFLCGVNTTDNTAQQPL
jgi:hypothetical protein